MKFGKSTLILLVIVVLGAFLRLFNLDQVPLYGDELTITLDSYSLLKNGTDQLGNPWPITFQMGAGRPAGYVYSNIPFVALFGPGYLGVRLLSVLSGLGLIILIYLLAKRLISQRVGLWAAFLTAISPWGINLSRGGFEANFALFLLLLGTVLVVYLKKPWYLILATLCIGLVIHTYPTYKLTLPLYLVILLCFTGSFRQILDKKQAIVTVLSGIILAGAVGLAIQQTVYNNSEGRFSDINIFSSEEISQAITQRINSERTVSQLPEALKPLLINKYLEYSFLYTENYLKNLSIDFLFLHGDGNPRHNMSVSGGLYLIEMVTLVMGVLLLFSKQKRLLGFLAAWVLIAPLSTALIDNPHFLRSAMMLPPLIILSAVGLDSLKGRILWLVIGIFVLQFLMFSSKLYFFAPSEFGRFWSESAKLATKYIGENGSAYDEIFVSDEIDNIQYAYPVYTNVDPTEVIENRGKQDKLYGKVHIGTIPVIMLDEFIGSFEGSALYIGQVTRGSMEIIQGEEILHTKDGRQSLVVKKYEK